MAIWRSCLLSNRRTPAKLSLAMPKGSGAVTRFFWPTLSAKVWPSGVLPLPVARRRRRWFRSMVDCGAPGGLK